MITNKQYKEDINSLLKIIRILYETDGRSLDSEEMYQIQTRINAISDKDEEVMLSKWPNGEPKAVIIPPSQFKGSNKVPAREQDKIDREERKRKFREDSEPHDLGNTLHIPGEDD